MWTFLLLFLYCRHHYRCTHLPPPLYPHYPSPFASLHPAPPLSPSLWPSSLGSLCLWLMHIYSLANHFPFFHPVPRPHSCQSVPCIYVCFYFGHQLILFTRLDVDIFIPPWTTIPPTPLGCHPRDPSSGTDRVWGQTTIRICQPLSERSFLPRPPPTPCS